MNTAPHVWIKETRPEVLRAGEAREAKEESANQSYDNNVVAPPCPGCGKGVSDKDWDRHRAEVHNRPRQIVRPYGRADAREALISAPDLDKLEQKTQEWRERHPGIRLLPLGEGKNRDTGLYWVRYKVVSVFREKWAS